MRVVHLSAEKSWRGGEQQLAYLITELNHLGCKQLVVCKTNSAFENYCKSNDISYVSLPFKTQFDIYSSIKIKSIAKNFKAEIIHAHSSHAHSLAVWSYYLGNKTKIILSRKVDFAISNNLLSKIKYNCNGIKKIICVSIAVQKILIKSLKDPKITTVVYDGIDLNKFGDKGTHILRKEFAIGNDKLIIASTAALADHKDYPTFIKMIIALSEFQNLQFFIIGTGPLTNQLKQKVIELKLNEKIIFTGFRNDLDKILPDIDVFVLCSKTEGLGSSILDAFACGIPVVATAAGGIPELIIDNENGILVPIGNAELLAKSIAMILQNYTLKEKLIINGKRTAIAFSKERMAADTLKVYQSI
jgi:glycosyltransferase involved in cell wall biosynthesis